MLAVNGAHSKIYVDGGVLFTGNVVFSTDQMSKIYSRKSRKRLELSLTVFFSVYDSKISLRYIAIAIFTFSP
jgi:hypothetical protein